MNVAAFLKAALAIAVAATISGAGYYLLEATRHAILLTSAVIFMTLAYFVTIFRGRLRDAALLCASLALGLVLVEAVLLLVNTSPITYVKKGSFAITGGLGRAPARAGAIHERKAAASGETIYDAVYTIDDDLTRKVASSADGPTIAFFGDSFTFGLGLGDADTLPQAFADLTGRKFHVLNLAMAGWGPQQFLRALEIGAHRAQLSQNPRLFVMLTAPWHAFRTSCLMSYSWFGPAYALQNGEPVYQGSCASRAPLLARVFMRGLRLAEAFNLNNFLESRKRPLERADIDLYIAILIEAARIARETYGVPTLILYLPDDLSSALYRLDPGYGNEDVIAKLREGGLSVIDARLDPSAGRGQPLWIPGDGHPTGLANRIWAERVRDFVMTEISVAAP